jgi:hypothetical protein
MLASRMAGAHVVIEDGSLRVRLARWQKVLGLMRDIEVPVVDLAEVEVVEDPMPRALQSGIKVGLRLPWLYYVARTIRLDEAFVVRRGVPALSFAVRDGRPLQRALVSAADARELCARLRRG